MSKCSRPERVEYRLEAGQVGASEAVGVTGRAGLASFSEFLGQVGVAQVLSERVRLPMQERRTGFTGTQKSLALLVALAAGSRSARDSDFTVGPDPVTLQVLGLPRWPHSSQLTRHLRACRIQHLGALRAAFEDVLSAQSAVRRRLCAAGCGGASGL